MTGRHKPRKRGKGAKGKARSDQQRPAAALTHEPVEVMGWTILAHPLFLSQIERLVEAAEAELERDPAPGVNMKLLAHVLDLAFDKIPREPSHPMYRQGGTLGAGRKHWFRAKTGNGRYRLFFRFHSSARVIVYAWLNDEHSKRTYGSRSDAYAEFGRMLDSGRPPSDWDELVRTSGSLDIARRLGRLKKRSARRSRSED